MKDVIITCNTCDTEVGYDTPCPNGCDTAITDLVNKIMTEVEDNA